MIVYFCNLKENTARKNNSGESLRDVTYFCGVLIQGQDTQLVEPVAALIELEHHLPIGLAFSVARGVCQLLTTNTAILAQKQISVKPDTLQQKYSKIKTKIRPK